MLLVRLCVVRKQGILENVVLPSIPWRCQLCDVPFVEKFSASLGVTWWCWTYCYPAGPRADANTGVHRGAAGEICGGAVPTGGGESEGVPALGGKREGARGRRARHRSPEVDGWDLSGLVVGVRHMSDDSRVCLRTPP